MMSAEEKHEIRNLVKLAAEEAIQETFKVMGIDIDDLDHLETFRENHIWVRKYRKMSENIGSRVILTLVTMATLGLGAAILAYLGYTPKN